MSLLDVNLNDSMEFGTLPDNQEAKLEIIRAELTESKSQSPATHNLALVLASEQIGVDDIRIWLPVPNEEWKDVDEKAYVKSVNRIKDVCACFSISMPCEVEDMTGNSGWCLMGEGEDDLNPGKMRNFVRRYIQAK